MKGRCSCVLWTHRNTMHLKVLKNIKFKGENERPLVSLTCYCFHLCSIHNEILQYSWLRSTCYVYLLMHERFVFENYNFWSCIDELPFRFYSDSWRMIELESKGAYDSLHILHLIFTHFTHCVCVWHTWSTVQIIHVDGIDFIGLYIFITLKTQFFGTTCPISMKFIHDIEGVCRAYIPIFKWF